MGTREHHSGQIVEVLREHRRRTEESYPEGWCACTCGEAMWDHDEHIAELLAPVVAAETHPAEPTHSVDSNVTARIAALVDAVEEVGCDHPTYYLEEPGRYKPRWPGGWCETCEEWRARLRTVVPGGGEDVEPG